MKSVAKANIEFTIFNFGNNEIRVLDKNGEPWFVARDLCDVLGIANNRDGIARLDEDEKGVALTDTLGGVQELGIVSESGMYTLVLRCRDAIKPGTVPHTFRKWVTAEVLPAIRKHGFYEKPAVVKKDHQSTATQLIPLRQTAERLIATGLGKIYPDIWKYVHSKFEVKHIHQLTPAQIGEAIEYLNALEGEYIGKQKNLPLAHNQFTDEELCKLCWLWSYATHMASYMLEVEPILRAAEHRLAGAYYSMPRESTRVLNASRRMLQRETMHIERANWHDDNWRVLDRMRIDHPCFK